MKLYMHCGYHKTGSSFLQTLFARNRGLLLKHHYHFPVAVREYDMLSGNISPGNGSELAEALKNNNEQKALELTNKYATDARRKGSDSILLSSENFFHAFESQQAIKCLVKVSEKNGIERIHALVYFRDPVSHALSTFKHRAKSGKILNYAAWLEDEYETMGLIDLFLKNRDKFPIQWTCRKYSANSEYMAKSAFTDWLGVATPAIPDDDRVNRSLTLPELLVIQTLNKNRQEFIPFVRQAFAGLPHSEKATDSDLAACYRAIASGKLTSYERLIDDVNKLLPENEQLKLTLPDETADHTEHDYIALTQEQVAALVAGIEAGTKSERVLHKSKAVFMKVVDKLNRKIKTFSA